MKTPHLFRIFFQVIFEQRAWVGLYISTHLGGISLRHIFTQGQPDLHTFAICLHQVTMVVGAWMGSTRPHDIHTSFVKHKTGKARGPVKDPWRSLPIRPTRLCPNCCTDSPEYGTSQHCRPDDHSDTSEAAHCRCCWAYPSCPPKLLCSVGKTRANPHPC